MPFDFATTGKSLRSNLAVPELPLEAIRGRLHAARRTERFRLSIIAALIVAVGGAGVATGAGAKMVDTFRIWLKPGGAAVEVQAFTMVTNPRAAEVADVVHRAAFPLVLPVGLPARTRIERMMYTPADHPAAVVLQYRIKALHVQTSITLIDSTLVNNGPVPLSAFTDDAPIRRWTIGSEMVLTGDRKLSAATMNALETAMRASSPAQSLASMLPMLPQMTVFGYGDPAADRAQQLAGSNSHAVLLDASRLRLLGMLAKQGKPLIDARIVALSNIKTVNNAPDYQHATLHWSRRVVIAASAVRSLAAAARTIPKTRELLYLPSSAGDRAMTIDLRPPHDSKPIAL